MKIILRVIVLCALLILVMGGTVFAQQPTIDIVINGNPRIPSVPAQNIDGRVMVPLRFVSEALGAHVGWDPATNTAIVRRNPAEVSIDTPLHAESGTDLKLEIEGVLKTDVTLVRSNGSVLVPLRVISEAFGALVDWSDAEQRVTIDLISFKIDGRFVTPDIPARLIGGRTVVPLRFVSQALGAQVGWDAATYTAIVRKGFKPELDSSVPASVISDTRLKAEANGEIITDASMTIIGNRVMVPMRLIGQMLNAQIDWDDATKTVVIQTPPAPEEYLEDALAVMRTLPAYSISGMSSVSGQFEKDGLLYALRIDRIFNGGHELPDRDHVKMIQKAGEFETTYEIVVDAEGNNYVREDEGLWRENDWNDFALYAAQTQPKFYSLLAQDVGIPLWYTQGVNHNGKVHTIINGELTQDEISIKFSLWIDPETGQIVELLSAVDVVETIEGVRVPLHTSLHLGYSARDHYEYMPVITPDQIAPGASTPGEQTP